MKKLIIKTIVITLIIILVASFSLFGLISLTSPSIIANATFKLNLKDACINYSVKQYEKTESYEDLSLLVERTAWASDYELTSSYAPILLGDPKFEEHLKLDPTYKTYIAGLYVESLYKTGKKEKFIEVAFSYYTGKSEPNTVRIAILTAKTDKETLNAILKKLKAFEVKTEETNYLIKQINQILK